jgi:hypothetical protein
MIAHKMPKTWHVYRTDARMVGKSHRGKTKPRVKAGLYRCTDCDTYKTFDKFTKNSSKKHGIQSFCKPCGVKIDKKRKAAPRGAINDLFNSARGNSKQRAKNRPQMLDHDLPSNIDEQIAYFFELAERQNYLCAISGRLLDPRDASLERIDEDKPYTKTNLCLISRDFQSGSPKSNHDDASSQWTRAKFDEVGQLRVTDFEPNYDLWDRALSTPYKKNATTPEQTLRRRMNRANKNAKKHTIDRNTRGRKHCKPEIDEAFLVELFKRQGGRCFYTLVPLSVHGHYKFSIERMDDDIGYTKANTVLVIMEVNHGNAKWSKAKADDYWGAL